MTDALLTPGDWADLRITHPDVWHLIQTDSKLEALAADVASLKLGSVKLELDYFPGATAKLQKARGILAKQAIEQGRSADLRPAIDLAAQGRGGASPTFLNRFDVAITGTNPSRPGGDSLRYRGCMTSIDGTGGRDVIMVNDYSEFPMLRTAA